MKKILFIFLSTVVFKFSYGQKLITTDSAGNQLKQFYINQRVDSLWIAGHHVNWETGAPDEPNATTDTTTHCSAFVASVCHQLGIYILRPPAHETELLANAQYKWLFSKEAADSNWKQIKLNVLETAQRYADSGIVVVAVYKNPNPKWSGHIALVMPAEKTIDDVHNEGPVLIQAGRTNTNNITFRQAFRYHLTSWPPNSKKIVFFYNDNNKK